MTQRDIQIEYLASHSELADELAKYSWAEWRSIYEHRKETFNDALATYRARTNVDHLPLALVAFAGGCSSARCR
jgi:hypothetical protein